ncbi:MAG: glycosyltransferase family 4 protein [Prolixibacteraceae bacterium]|nr:glycosyltransferase family 4 protein [Burkholderiales bacterium]
MKALLITGWLPVDGLGPSTGLLVRQRLFVDALAKCCEQVTIMYMAHHDPDYAPLEDSALDMQATIARDFGDTFKLHVCRRRAPLKMNSPAAYMRAAASIYCQPGYASVSGSVQVEAIATALQAKPDLIFAHRLQSMLPLMRLRHGLPPLFFDLDDIEHIALQRYCLRRPTQWKLLSRLTEIPALVKAERAAIKLATTTFVCSTLDVRKLQARFGADTVQAVPNCIRIPPDTVRSDKPRLLMLGNFAYPPNRHGLEYFVETILPMVRREVPNVELLVAGTSQHKLGFAARPPAGVHLLGFVPSLDDAYSQASVAICPIYTGGGTRIKIVEAAAYGMPIVSTRIGAEGIDLQEGAEILIADTAADFASACARVLKDHALAARLGAAARQAAVAKYDRSMMLDTLAAEFRKGVEARQRAYVPNPARQPVG